MCFLNFILSNLFGTDDTIFKRKIQKLCCPPKTPADTATQRINPARFLSFKCASGYTRAMLMNLHLSIFEHQASHTRLRQHRHRRPRLRRPRVLPRVLPQLR